MSEQATATKVHPNLSRARKRQATGPGTLNTESLAGTLPVMEYKGLRRQPSQLRGAQRINEVLDATETLLKVHHFDTITIEDIAKRAQVQVGSLYHFFEGKDRRASVVA